VLPGAGAGSELEGTSYSSLASGGVEEVAAVEGVAARGPACLAPSLLYAAALLLVGVVYFYADYRSFDAHLARAERAKLYQRPEAALDEYRAALGVREDAHTRKLLGVELLRAGRAAEALEELRAAGRLGAGDETISFHAGSALDALARRDEAAEAYREFLRGPSCSKPEPEALCGVALSRLRAPSAEAAR
jgi:tetratricopeptide (TPR) repeat protein